jgi:ATP-binding cassette subfamily B protein
VPESAAHEDEGVAPSGEGEVDRTAGWRLMRTAVGPHSLWVALGIGAGLGWTIARVSVPKLTGKAVDLGVERDDNRELFKWVLILLAAGTVQAVFTGIRRYAAFRLALRVETDLRMRLVAHLQRLHFAFHDHAQTGQLMARANSDIAQVQNVVLMIPLTIASTLTMIAVAIVLLLRDPLLALFALATLPMLQFAAMNFSHRMFPIGLAQQEKLAELSGVVEESITGIRVVKGFGAERRQIARLDREAESVYERSIAAAYLRAWFLPLIDLLPTLGLVGILWYGGHRVLDGKLSVGDILAANFYVLMLIWPLRMLGMLLGQIPRALAAAGRIHEVLATEPVIADRPGARRLPEGQGDVCFAGVSFSYGPGAPVLDELDLTIRGGEAVALVGATASGKSTVARLLPRFYDVTDGQILLDGVDVRDLRLHDLRTAIGLVFEDTFLFTETVRDNIAFANPEAPMEDVRRAARLAGADEFVSALPQGYDTLVGQHGYTLSGGQRQRLAIARAVLADPRVLILDDATSSVDPSKEHEIRAALAEVMRGRTTIVIAHRPATIALADRVVLLDRGKVVADGTHDELLASNERYREVLARAEVDEIEGHVDNEGAAAALRDAALGRESRP